MLVCVSDCLWVSADVFQASKAKGGKKKVERASSNVFAMFDQKQIQEFKEVSQRLLKTIFMFHVLIVHHIVVHAAF